MTYDAAAANAKVLALMAAVSIEKPCGCVVSQERGHTHTKLCKQHLRSDLQPRGDMKMEEEKTAGEAVPLQPLALLKEKPVKTKTVKKTAKKKVPPKKKAAPKKEAKRTAPVVSDGLGRPGSIGRYICEAIVAGGDNKKVSEAAIKKFDNKKINTGYVSWWRNKLVRNGVIKATK